MAVLTEKNAILLNVGVGQEEEESIHFPFYSSKISRIAHFHSSNNIPHCCLLLSHVYSSLSSKIFLSFNFLAICDFDSNIFWTPPWPSGGVHQVTREMLYLLLDYYCFSAFWLRSSVVSVTRLLPVLLRI